MCICECAYVFDYGISPGQKPTGCRLIAEHECLWCCSCRSAGTSRKREKVDRMKTRGCSQPYIWAALMICQAVFNLLLKFTGHINNFHWRNSPFGNCWQRVVNYHSNRDIVSGNKCCSISRLWTLTSTVLLTVLRSFLNINHVFMLPKPNHSVFSIATKVP